MNRTTKISALLVAVGMGFALSACSPEALPKDSAAKMSAAATAPVKAAAKAKAPAKTVAPPVEEEQVANDESATTCDVAREAALTGSHAEMKAAMTALKGDRSQDADAREAAKGWLKYDGKGGDKDMQGMYESSIEMFCSLSD